MSEVPEKLPYPGRLEEPVAKPAAKLVNEDFDKILLDKKMSRREIEVVKLAAKGFSNKELASQLFVTEKTIKFHLTNIYKKMEVKSRSQLIVWCSPHLTFKEAD